MLPISRLPPPLIAARAAAIVAATQVQGADGSTIITFVENSIVTPFGAFNVAVLFVAMIVWATISCVFLASTAFVFGRSCGRRPVERLATMRPAVEGPPAVPAACPTEGEVHTTRFGKYWHVDARCRYLDKAQILARSPCPLCVRDRPARPSGAAETPPRRRGKRGRVECIIVQSHAGVEA